MNDGILTEYFRCPADTLDYQSSACLSGDQGYFRFGHDTVGYGRTSAGFVSPAADRELYDTLSAVRIEGPTACLPFDPSEVINNLRGERYMQRPRGVKGAAAKLVRNSYYLVRPLLPVRLRKHLQKAHLKGWRDLCFPHWPVDTSVDTLIERLLALAIKARGGKPVPFIWFWPDGMSACSVMTHDVETQLGVDLSVRLMDMNESAGVQASFQVIPEERYPVKESYLDSLRRRGFEVNVHDLNHDGHLFRERREFERRVAKINQYGKQYRALGFRAAVLYRNQEWFDRLEFDYDMSVPNVAHLDPQRGGCCTVMPYFVGKIVELPVTVIQDYSLFNILNDYSTSIWEQQAGLILKKHGLINVIVHPDYITGPREERVYRDLLDMFARMRSEQKLWVTLPKDVSNWWRQRSQMTLVQDEGGWRVRGAGSERAQVAFAYLEDGELRYRLAVSPSTKSDLQPSH